MHLITKRSRAHSAWSAVGLCGAARERSAANLKVQDHVPGQLQGSRSPARRSMSADRCRGTCAGVVPAKRRHSRFWMPFPTIVRLSARSS
jgi:hypothetical protein